MSGVNKVFLIGRLGTDPEIKTLPNSDAKVCNFTVATSDSWKGKGGEAKERTEWHRIVVWEKTAELCARYLTKGKMVYIEGSIQTRSWEKDGQKLYVTEIKAQKVEFLSPKEEMSRAPLVEQFPQEHSGPGFEEEIPF